MCWQLIALFPWPNDFDHNVRLVMVISFINKCAITIWQGAILVVFVFLIEDNSNRAVGIVAGLSGVAQLVCAPMIAYAADAYPRTEIFRYGSIIGFVGFCIAVVALLVEEYFTLCAAMVVVGVAASLTSPALDAVVADSVTQGSRSRVYTWKFTTLLVGAASGPLVALVMFGVIGDKWTVDKCRVVMFIGLLLSLVPLWLMRMFEDDAPPVAQTTRSEKGLELPEYSPVNTEVDSESVSATLVDGSDDSSAVVENDADVELGPPSCTTTPIDESGHVRGCCCCPDVPIVPAMIVLGDLMGALASGMSLKFFPIFFKENIGLVPTELSCMDLFTMLLCAAVATAFQRSSRTLGRMYAVLLSKVIGLSFFVLLLYCYHYGGPPSLVVGAYMIRTASMNSTRPLAKSAVMDLIPASERVRWNALESFNQAGWAGSAVLGGFLMDAYGVEFNFSVTIVMQTLSLLPVVGIAHLVPNETGATNIIEICRNWLQK